MELSDALDKDQNVKMLGEYSARELTDEEINSVAGARFVSTISTGSAWGPNPFCPCADSVYVDI